jgi:hypothetical protein
MCHPEGLARGLKSKITGRGVFAKAFEAIRHSDAIDAIRVIFFDS